MREDTQDSDEEGIVDPDEVGSDMREAVEYIITAFRAPLEARGFSAEAILDELEEAISYARKYLPIATETCKKVWYALHTCPDASKWQTYSCCASSSLAYLFLPAELSRFSLG